MFRIEWIKDKIGKGEYYYSGHGDQERQRDNLFIGEIADAIQNGIILENYKNTGRGESCLIAGFTKEGKPIHIVCGKRENWLVIITVYIPTAPKFKTPYERG